MLLNIDIGLTDTQTKDDISATQFKLQCNIGGAMQGNAAQHWWINKILAANTVAIKLLKWYIQTFLVKMVIGIFISQTQKIDDCK